MAKKKKAKKAAKKTKKMKKSPSKKKAAKKSARKPKKSVKKKASKKKKVTKKAAKRPSPVSSTPETLKAPPVPVLSLKEGDAAPDFSAETDDGRRVSLADFRGRKLVLYFYPKDDTPGCTKEACAFRDGIARIRESGAEVLGVSADDVDSHRAFREKYQLNFPLLSDASKKIVQDYGVWKEKNMYGRTFMGIDRTTFLINEQGTIRRIFPKVNVEIHYDEILSALGA